MTPPSDKIEVSRVPALTAADIRRIVAMRREAGAVEVSMRVYIRPAGKQKKFTRLQSATRAATVHSAFNVEQIITGGPLAGTTFTAPRGLHQLYEDQNQ